MVRHAPVRHKLAGKHLARSPLASINPRGPWGMNQLNVSVVVFDSESLFRDSLAQVLDASGLQVVGKASRGEDFQRVVKNERPTIALMDWDTGNPGEVRQLEEARLNQPDTKFIVMASHPDALLMNKSVQAGAWALIDKSADGSDVAIDTV